MDKKTLEIQIKLLANQALSQVKEFSNDIKNAADKAKGFTGDAKGVATSIKTMQAEAQRTANQMKLFGLTSSDLRNTTQNLKKTILDLTDSGLKPESKEVQNLVQKYKELEEQTNKAEASEQGLFGVIGKLKNEIGSLAAVAAAVKVDQAVGNLAKSSLDVNNSFQKIKDDFGIMLGDVEAGIGLFNELQEFNFWTPFDIEQTSQAAKVLVSAKVPLKDLTDYLTRFGDIAQGDAQKFQSYINAFSKASAKGKADMEVLNVYTDQGVQILDALGQQLGKTSAEIVKMASEGKISFQDLDNALQALASDGGLYYGTMEKAAMRLDAVQAGLQESVKSLKASFGQMLAPAVSAVISLFTKLVDSINNSPILKGLLAGAIAAIVTIINVNAVKALVALATKIWAAYAAQMGLNAAMSVSHPAILAVTAAAALATAGFVAYASAQQDAANETSNLAYEAKQAENAIRDLKTILGQKTNDELEDTLSILVPQLADAEKKLKELNEKYSKPVPIRRTAVNVYDLMNGSIDYDPLMPDSYLGENEIDSARKNVEDLKSQIAAVKKELEERTFAKNLAEGNEILKKRNELYKKTDQGRREALEKELSFAKSLYSLETVNDDGTKSGFDRAKTSAIIKDIEDQIASLDGAAKKKLDEQLKKAQENADKWLYTSENQIEKIKKEFEKTQDKLAADFETLIANGAATEEDKIKALANLKLHYDKLEEEARKKAQEEYWQKEAEEAAKRIKSGDNSAYKDYIKAEGLAQIQDTAKGSDLAKTLNGGLMGFIGSLIAAFVSLVSEIESVQKILNFTHTILGKMFELIGPVINDILEPIVEILETLGTELGNIIIPFLALIQILTIVSGVIPVLKILTGLLQLVGGALEWLYNSVIVPFGNKVIDLINGVIDAINKIPFVNISKLNKLRFVGDMAESLAESLEESLELVRKKYERQKDKVQSMLDAQLEALQSQYELGLISRQEYEAQAEDYSQKADSQILEITKAMEEHLAGIEDGTRTIEENIPALATYQAEEEQTKDPLDYKKQALYSYMPQTLTQEIQNSNSSILSPANSQTSITINVEGSVIKEQELVDTVYTGIVRGIKTNKYNALGA